MTEEPGQLDLVTFTVTPKEATKILMGLSMRGLWWKQRNRGPGDREMGERYETLRRKLEAQARL